MRDEIIPILNDILRQYGYSLLTNPARLNAFLLDLAGDYRIETRLLVLAARENIPLNLMEPPTNIPATLLLGRLVKQIQDDWGLTQENAEWTINAWNQALDRPFFSTPTELKQINPAVSDSIKSVPIDIPSQNDIPSTPVILSTPTTVINRSEQSVSDLPVVIQHLPTLPITPDQQRLINIMLDMKRTPAKRAKAGRDINQYGDPRQGVIDFNFGTDYWCKVPAGEFIMGSDQDSDNKTREESIAVDIWIGKYPITYAQYKAFLDDPDGYYNPQWWEGLSVQGLVQRNNGGGTQKWPNANQPAEHVSWYDAIAFCAWLNAKLTIDQSLKSQGYSIRLPTEREWEKSAKGTDGREYPYSGKFDVTKGNTSETGIGQTSAVGIFPDGSSPYDILDLSGNVFEWTLTEYRNSNSKDISSNGQRVVRGGSWFNNHVSARTTFRGYCNPAVYSDYRGFRVCCGAAPLD